MLLLLPSAALAVDEASTQGPDLTRYFVVCAGLLGLVLALAWVFRRFVAESLRKRAAKRSLQVVDMLPLGGKQKLVVVRCYDRTFLLGLGDREVRSIAELDAETADARVAVGSAAEPRDEEPQAAIEPFDESLAEVLRRPQPLRVRDQRALERWKQGEGVLG